MGLISRLRGLEHSGDGWSIHWSGFTPSCHHFVVCAQVNLAHEITREIEQIVGVEGLTHAKTGRNVQYSTSVYVGDYSDAQGICRQIAAILERASKQQG